MELLPITLLYVGSLVLIVIVSAFLEEDKS